MEEDEHLSPARQVRWLAQKHEIHQENALEVDNVATGPEAVRTPTRPCRRLLGDHHAQIESYQGLIAGIEVPHPEDFGIEELAFHAYAVEKGLVEEPLLHEFEVDDAPVEKDRSGEANIVDLVDVGLVEGLAWENREKSKIKLHDHV